MNFGDTDPAWSRLWQGHVLELLQDGHWSWHPSTSAVLRDPELTGPLGPVDLKLRAHLEVTGTLQIAATNYNLRYLQHDGLYGVLAAAVDYFALIGRPLDPSEEDDQRRLYTSIASVAIEELLEILRRADLTIV